ncbi:thioredoxin-disulfide reductase [Alicyclobacillus acidocaldarius]|uniref:Thioredoxin reductase n=1 Tax=Alicyclobacillus acidocaldarius subsp. acidocaldarius (strain ATCC 27009 / DSM 446 / BCRC 14685 / JCM 5260 / KCTC 1825 / NBRC 15652 / NCIMB 11725 / NRRL B-14509 / 104-IA) TaxID=521098 RepID=C8WUT8_ALIAD|nr:thioredoxin-disulfide reductase [Alicyclobacillus acidocaldarius]ACV57927.1 thioredoxin reductase [Alicyclobacillus acidocaldarius subsp. acidocaldarius DSM 446]
MEHRRLIILGTGPAGYTAAIYAARANLEPLVFEGDQAGGQLTMTTEVENFPGFPDGVMGPELMEAMKKQAEKFGAEFRSGIATGVDLSQRPFKVVIDKEHEYTADALIVATGASAKLLGIEGESEMIGRGVSTCATCDGFFFRNKRVIVVGGGDSAMEEATFLTKFASEVTIVHRREEFRASKIMQERAKANPKIRFVMNVQSKRVLSDGNKVTGLEVVDNRTGETKVLEADGVFVAIGHKPNTDFLRGQLELDEIGYIITKGNTSETSVEGVFACGDVMDSRYRQAITAAGSGCKAAMDAEKFLEGQAAHDWSVSLNA